MPLMDADQGRACLDRLQEVFASPADVRSKLLLLRQLLESVYKKLSEGVKTSFGGLFARMQYVHSRLDPPPALVSQVNQLRILCNKAAHEESFPLAEGDLYSGILTLRDLLAWLNPDLRDPGLDKLLQERQARPFPEFTGSRKESFVCVVERWKVLHSDDTGSGIEITATVEDGSDCTILLNDLEGEGRNWSALDKVLWQYCTLNCLNLTPVRGRERCYQSNPLTMVVAEPDFLVDASSLAECFTNQGTRPEYYVLGRMVKEATTDKITQGNIANAILDELVLDPEADFQTLFRKCLARQPISLVALEKPSAMGIYETIGKEHFPRLKEFAASLKDDSVQLEPSYVNPNYGLQGRLDILHSSGGKKNIVELKSGNPPAYNTWPSHQMQVVAYNLIIRDCYPRPELGTSSIFYSASEDNRLRHVVNTVQLEQSLLMCRNRIIGIVRGLASDPAPFFKWLTGSDIMRHSGFMRARVEAIINTLQSLPEHEYEWFLEQVRLAIREIWFEKTGGLGQESIYGHNALWQESLSAKRERYKVLDSLQLANIRINLARFRVSQSDRVTDFRAGDIVVLYRQRLAIEKQEILRGQITGINNETVEVLIRGGLRRIPEQLRNELWSLEHDILETSLYNPLSQIYSFLEAKPQTRELYLGLSQPKCAVIPELGGDQLEEIIGRMFAAQDYFIVQGPPGTGKTSGLLTKYVGRIFDETPKNILILSFTNRAVDEICLNLRKQGIPFLRTGQSDEISAELMNTAIEGKKYDEISALLKANRIWVATVSSCNSWMNDLLKIIRVDELVVDEASQIMENSILGIITKVGKTILVGDQNQLPPISRQADEGFSLSHEKLAGLCYGPYGQSLMERLNKVCDTRGWHYACAMLRTHYRMHDEIAGLVQRYYRNELVSFLPRQQEPLPENADPLLSSRMVWIECPPSRYSYYDPLQVQCIIRILERWQEAGVIRDFGTDVGIVSPFRAMIHTLVRELKPGQEELTVDTVERFQGSERANIILTLPLRGASDLRNVEALSSDGTTDRKLNVALSRALERVVVVGNAELCRGSEHYNFLMDKIRLAGKVLNIQDIIQGVQNE